MRTLVADDSRSDRMVLERILAKLGHEVTSSHDGRTALEEMRKHPFPIAFIDWMMPELDGLDLCRSIREAERGTGGYTYIIMATAKDRKENIIQALEAGADDFISKPLDADIIASRVRVAERIINANAALTEKNLRLEFLQGQLIDHNVGLKGQVETLKARLAGITKPRPAGGTTGTALELGEAYLIECLDGANNMAYTMFITEISNGTPGFILSRAPEKRLREMYGLKDVNIINLSKGLGDGSGPVLPLNFLALDSSKIDYTSNRNLQAIVELVKDFMERNKGAAVLLDGIEYLFTRFQMLPTMEMLYELSEVARSLDGKMMIAYYPDTLDPKVLPLLKREMSWHPLSEQ